MHTYMKVLYYPLDVKFIHERGDGNRSTSKNNNLIDGVHIYKN